MRSPGTALGRVVTRIVSLAAVPIFLAATLGLAGGEPSSSRSKGPSGPALSGPFVHENLAVYVVRGRTSDPRAFITLREGLAAGSVTVREKGGGSGRDEAQVNALEVENKSNRWLFLQAGDVVAGGKQDRTIAIDVTLGPRSGPQPIDAFCVEHGRWAPKSGGMAFSGNTAIVSGNALKMSIQGEKNQSRVWEEVAKKESKAAQRIAVASPGEPVSPLSASGTYNAIVAHKSIRSGQEEYVKALSSRLDAPDALGIVVAINGKLTAADVYASSALFRKLAGKLLDSYALEAALDRAPESIRTAPPGKDAVMAFLGEASSAQGRDEKIGATMHRRTREGRRVVLYEYRDGDALSAASPVHTNYLARTEPD